MVGPSRHGSSGADVRARCEEDVAGPPLTEDEPVHVGAAVASVDALLDDLWR